MSIIKKGEVSSSLQPIKEFVYVCKKCGDKVVKVTDSEDVTCEKCNEKMTVE